MRFAKCFALVSVAGLMSVTGVRAENSATVTIRADEPGAVISSNLFGAFFEEINFAGDGGLYAEMVRNRSFYDANHPEFWTLLTTGSAKGAMAVDTANPLNAASRNSLRLTMASGSGSVGTGNAGYWGMSLQSGATCNLSFYARSDEGFSGPINARLESADGSRVYAQVSVTDLTGQWQRFAVPLVSTGTDTNARLVLSISTSGTVWLNWVSLFPKETFLGRPNGLRPDLASKLAALKPSFLRFPGGCFIEGNVLANAFRWKSSIGDVTRRPGHWNGIWNYFSTDGLGFHEYLQLCEDIGAKPLFGINCGMSHNEVVPMAELRPFVQDALDAIEYANGSTNTTWGAMRAVNGHPAPFNLRFVEVGNENGGPAYDERFALFYDAIKSAHPEMNIIACVWSGTPSSRPFDLMDEHYYSSPLSFLSFATKYDGYSRNGPKVFVGEYAVTSGHGVFGNLAAALGEAAFMTGMERNADIVRMACYAPLFANVNGMQWHPNLINFDNTQSFGTPAYYVQEMFSQNRGDVVLPATVKISNNAKMRGAIGLGSWNTSVEYTNVEVKKDGKVLYQSDFSEKNAKRWRIAHGSWSTTNGYLSQSDTTLTDCRAVIGDTNWSDYSITLRARKTGGSEGFLILFNWRDDDNWTWFNIGGWQNSLAGIEQCCDGVKATIGTPVPQTIQPNTWYDIRITLSDQQIRCYVNGHLVQDVTYPGQLFVSTSRTKADGQIIVKAVNASSSPLATTFKLNGVDSVAPIATITRLTSADLNDENTLSAPTHVYPATTTITNAGKNFALTLPANSLSVIRLRAAGAETFTNLSLRLPLTLESGQVIESTLLGHKAGSPTPLNLTANASHAITYSSDNPAIATVDCQGKVSGVGGGVVNIIASYDSLGLVATQTVNVIKVSARLAHRYSFTESTGNVCADSIGGPIWNGALPAGGVFSNGCVMLSALASQYVQLPAGILGDGSSVTIESWVTFPGQLSENSFFFGFGNTNGDMGENYIFCAPQSGRVAITDVSYGQEQNAYGKTDFSFTARLHLTAVFNPPQGIISFYTNGVLAGINRHVTVPMNSVQDVYNFIGRSLYAADPYADLDIDEFRIYNGALTAEEIAENQVLGPDKLPTPKRSLSLR